MATDLTKVPLEILVDLINNTNGCALTTADITFSVPSALVAHSRNTAIVVTARPSSSYKGSRYLTYNRIPMSDIPGVRSTKIDTSGALTVKDLVPRLNAAYRLNLQPEDYFDDPITDPLTGPNIKFTLRAKPGSYVYQGSLVLNGQPASSLENIINKYVLDGFGATNSGALASILPIRVLDGFTLNGLSP